MARLNLLVNLVSLIAFCNCYDQIYISKVDSEAVEGLYGSADSGIRFRSTASSLNITDSSGHQILTVYESSPYQQYIVIQGNVFVQLYDSAAHQYRDLYVPRTMLKDIHHLSRQLNFTVLKYLSTLSPRYHYKNLQRSVQTLIESLYAEAIKMAAYALGNQLNIYGNEYPSILPLYLVANMLEKLQTSGLPARDHCSITRNETDDSCFEECPPCPDEECLSLCGYGCTCWKWVCGDCCYHLGCYGHDVCCRQSFIQTKCLFPISFKCESAYEC